MTCWKIVMSLSFSQFTANVEQSGSQIWDTYSVKLKFSLIVTFYLGKTEHRTKNFFQNSHTIALSKGTILAKKVLIFAENADISKVKRALALKGIFSETAYESVLTCQI